MSKKKQEETVKEKSSPKYGTLQLGLVILFAIILITLCIVMLVKEISNFRAQQEIMDEFNEYYESDELSIIFYNGEGCSFCEIQRPILEQVARDYELKYLDLDITKITDSQNKKITEMLGIEGKTPTTVIVRNKKVLLAQVGYVQGNKYVEFLVNAGVLKEGSKYVPEENLTFIGYEEFENLKGSKEPVVVVIGSATCQYCTTAKPILSNLSKAYDIPIYYITLNYISSNERISLVDDLEMLGYDEDIFINEGSITTPTLLIIKDNKIIDYAEGLGNVTSYTKLFKDNGVIKN